MPRLLSSPPAPPGLCSFYWRESRPRMPKLPHGFSWSAAGEGEGGSPKAVGDAAGAADAGGAEQEGADSKGAPALISKVHCTRPPSPARPHGRPAFAGRDPSCSRVRRSSAMPDNASQIFAPKSVTAQPLHAAAALSDPFYWSRTRATR